jgi:uncharacterized protein (DUF2141 family)
MIKSSMLRLAQFLGVLLIFTRCSSDASKEVILPPSDLIYASNQIEIVEGQKVSSLPPTIKGTKPFTFSMVSNPTTSQISIDNQGVVSVLENITAGTYKISVIVSNVAQSITFKDIFTVNVKPKIVPVSNLTYMPNTVETTEGMMVSSPIPNIQGSSPITYTITTNPMTDQITVDGKGVISASNALKTGTYAVTITAKNEAGSATFSNAFTITVKAINIPPVLPSSLSYTPNKITTEQGKTIMSATPTISGTSPFSFSIVSTNTSNGNIAINANTGVVTASANTTIGTYNIDVNVRNTAGNVTFTNALSIVVESPAVPTISFAKDVQPILQVCGSCHNFNTYTGAKGNINNILDRVQRPQGSAGFMPQGGTPLTKTQVDILKKWLDDGLKE